MPRLLRRIIAVLVGTAVAFTVVMLVDLLVGSMHPVPEGTDVRDAESMAAVIAGMPVSALVVMVAGWALAAAIGAFVAVRLTPERRASAGHLVALLFLLATLANLAMLPHPGWMWAAALVALPLAGWLGARTGTGWGEARELGR